LHFFLLCFSIQNKSSDSRDISFKLRVLVQVFVTKLEMTPIITSILVTWVVLFSSQCPPCGPGSSGRCFGPSLCCGPLIGCIFRDAKDGFRACAVEATHPTLCSHNGIAQCPVVPGGFCALKGLCCNDRGEQKLYKQLHNFFKKIFIQSELTIRDLAIAFKKLTVTEC